MSSRACLAAARAGLAGAAGTRPSRAMAWSALRWAATRCMPGWRPAPLRSTPAVWHCCTSACRMHNLHTWLTAPQAYALLYRLSPCQKQMACSVPAWSIGNGSVGHMHGVMNQDQLHIPIRRATALYVSKHTPAATQNQQWLRHYMLAL